MADRHYGPRSQVDLHWYKVAFADSVEALSLASFLRVLDWPVEQIRVMVSDAKSQLANTDIEATRLCVPVRFPDER
jgi:hypothetical protein